MDKLDLREIRNELAEIVGEGNVSDADFELYAYSRDLSPAAPRLASFIVRPRSTEDVSGIVKLANKHKIPIYVRGCGCSHWAAWLPVKGGILLDMTSMEKILEIDEKNLVAVVEAGCTWFRLMEELRKRKLTYLSSEMGGPAMTIGGSIIKAGGGPYGTCKFGFHGQTDVLGLELVLPTGEVTKTGSWAMPKCAPFRREGLGPDLTGLFIGSEGIFGIATKVALRIRPLPEHEDFLHFEFDDWEDVVRVGDAATREVGDEMAYSLDCGEEASKMGVVSVRIHVFGYNRQIMQCRKRLLTKICRENNGKERDPDIAKNSFSKVVAGLPGIFAAGVWHFAGCGTVPIHELPKYVKIWREIVQKYGFFRNTFGAWAFPRGWTVYVHMPYFEPDEREKIISISNEINRRFFENGIVPYGIGGPEGLQPFLKGKLGAYYDLIRRIKQCLDPNNILQPSILVSLNDA
ncbi:MAG: FAD-binding oxidoreductase [Candidatus Bathyarchaeia archaeon]